MMSEITKLNTYVAFLDILGFKNMMLHGENESLLDFLKKANNLYSSTLKLIDDTIDESELNLPKTKEMFDFGSISLSDSIVIWSNKSDLKAFTDLMFYTSVFMLNSLSDGYPLRGAITFGDLYLCADETQNFKTLNVYGNSIIRAYELEKNQAWSGCLVDDLCVDRLLHNEELRKEYFNQSMDKKLFIEYEIPMDQGRIEKKYALNWVLFSGTDCNENTIEDSFRDHGRSIDDWRVRNKLFNTIEFFRHVGSERK